MNITFFFTIQYNIGLRNKRNAYINPFPKIYFTYRLKLYFSFKPAVFTSVRERNNKINTNICVFLIFKIEKNNWGLK